MPKMSKQTFLLLPFIRKTMTVTANETFEGQGVEKITLLYQKWYFQIISFLTLEKKGNHLRMSVWLYGTFSAKFSLHITL